MNACSGNFYGFDIYNYIVEISIAKESFLFLHFFTTKPSFKVRTSATSLKVSRFGLVTDDAKTSKLAKKPRVYKNFVSLLIKLFGVVGLQVFSSNSTRF